jgi:hypothetical protein
VFFKTKIKPDDFANYLVRDHHAIFGRSNLDNICKQFELHFRDEATYIEAFYEFQSFGLYSIAFGVRTQCADGLQEAILNSLNARFTIIAGKNWEMMRHRVAEYEEFGNRGPAGGLAAQNIFDRPLGAIQPKSIEAFGLSRVMDASCLDAVEAVKRLFKQFKFDA